jgi:flagellar biosynthesis/type III secretory pathway protein FliH
MFDGQLRHDCVMTGVAIAAIVSSLLFGPPATAQIAVTDPPVETSTAATASELLQTNQILGQDVRVNTQTAQSLTTPGGAGAWQSNDGYLNSLAANLNNGINSTTLFNSNFPGWQTLPANSTQLSKQISAIALRTYAGALAAAQQQAAGFGNEDSHLSGIEQTNQSVTTVLQGQQVMVEAILALCQQVQLQRQLQVMQIVLEATKAGEELNERAQEQATATTNIDLGVAP